MLQHQWPWLTPSGHPPSMSTASSHLLIGYTLLLYLTSKIVSPWQCTLVVYQFVFCFKREMCRKKKNPEMSSYLPFKHWPRYCIFSYSRNQVGYYILSWCNGDYDHIFTRCTRCPPACLCVHELSVDSYDWMEKDVIMMTMISGVYVLLLQHWMFLFVCFFLSMRDSWEVCARVCVCVLVRACARLLLNTYFLQSGKWIDVNLTACIWKKDSVWMYTHFCVLDCLDVVIAAKFKNIGTIAYVS